MTIRLGGWQPVTLIDFPGRVAATLFTAGCNFRCPFCHNAELVIPDRIEQLPPCDAAGVLSELKRRRGFLDGVVLTGGEPTVQQDLIGLIEELREIGLLVKLDTNGARPDVVERLLERALIDHIAVDIKGPPHRYAEFAGVDVSIEAIRETVRLVVEGGIDHELRTTVAPGLEATDLEAIARWIGAANRYVLQRFRVPNETGKSLLDPSWSEKKAMDAAGLRAAWASIGARFESGGVRS